MVARATWELALPCAWSGSTRQSLSFCHAPSQAAHSKASHFAVCLVRQHTAKPPILSWAWSGSTRQSIFSWFLKIITLLWAIWRGARQSWPLLRWRTLRCFCVPSGKKIHGIRFCRVPGGWRTTKIVLTVSYCVVHSVCSARQSLCRVLWAFCRVLEAHGKAPESGSERRSNVMKSRTKRES